MNNMNVLHFPLGMPSKKKLHMEGKVPFWGGGGKKKGPNFPSKRAKKVGN